MADVTISQLTQGIPAGNSILPYSTGSNTLGVPVSAVLQNAGDVRLGGRLAIGAADDPGPSQYNLELRGANPTRGVMGLVYNNAISPNNGAMIQYTQRGLGDWAMGCTAGGINGFSLYRGRGVNSDGTEAMRFDSSGNAEFFGSVKATALQVPGCIIQVVQGVKSDISGPIVSNGVETIVPGIAASITPKFSTSKILINAQICYATTALSTTYGGYFKRNNDIIAIGNAGTGQQRVSIPMAFSADNNQSMSVPYMYLDTPNSASVLTYQFYVINDNDKPIYINRSVLDYNNYAGTGSGPATGKRAISTITLMEIAG